MDNQVEQTIISVGCSHLGGMYPMLRGKIAAIVDEQSVVINLGAAQGVQPGMQFVAVYETEAVRDPDNPEETLGGLTFELATLAATSVQNKMTYCKILDPYVFKGFELEFSFLPKQQGESKVDPGARKIGGPQDLKLKVGTVVREAVQESKKSTPAKQGV